MKRVILLMLVLALLLPALALAETVIDPKADRASLPSGICRITLLSPVRA